MNKLIAPFLCTCACIGLAFAGQPQPSKDPAAVNAILQLEHNMDDAMVHVDIDKLNQIYADDFQTIGSFGKVVNKKDLLQDFQSFHNRLVSHQNGPIDVQVFGGDVAVAYGRVCAKRIRDGQARSGDFVWMDLLKKRAGKWVVVRSTGARVTWRVAPI